MDGMCYFEILKITSVLVGKKKIGQKQFLFIVQLIFSPTSVNILSQKVNSIKWSKVPFYFELGSALL